jgi:hypothetical protein
MIKYFLRFILIFLLLGSNGLFAQTTSDSSSAIDTVNASGLTNEEVDTAEETGITVNGHYLPVADSENIFSDTIRRVSQRQVRSYKLNPDYAYANDPEYWKKEKYNGGGTQLKFLRSPFLRWTILLGITALILFGVFQLLKESSFSWLLRKPKYAVAAALKSPADEEMDYDEVISKYQEEGNFRMAVRYMYLRLIRRARENGGIQIQDSSTNTDIVRAFQSHPAGKEFGYLARAYEYIFYGGFLPKEELYTSLKIRFDDFQRKLTV